MAVDILDTTNSSPVLVQTSGQPVKFWGIKGKERYQTAYFEQYGPNVWYQGDFVSMSPVTRGNTMLGRSSVILVFHNTRQRLVERGWMGNLKKLRANLFSTPCCRACAVLILSPPSSDRVLNGVRFGSAEIYNVTTLIPQFEETICVGQRRKNDTDEALLLFVKMKGGAQPRNLISNLIARTRTAICSAMSARQVSK